MVLKSMYGTLFKFCLILPVFCFSCADSNTDEEIKPSKVENHEDVLRVPVNLDGTVDSSDLAVLEFDDPHIHYGRIKNGAILEHEFTFVNSGTADLKIYDVRPSCGCTTTEYTEKLIPPDSTGVITVKFDSEGRYGLQRKPIKVTSNALPSEHELMLEVIVDSTRIDN